MPAHFAAKSIIRKQESRETTKQDSAVIYPDMTKFHPGGSGGFPGQGSAARQAEYSNGFEAGKAEAAEMYEQTIRVMETALEALKSSMQKVKQDLEISHGEVVKQCLQSLLPELSQEILRNEIFSVISEAKKSELDLRLTVKINPQNEIAKSFLLKSFGDVLTLIESDEMGASAVHFFRGASTTTIDPVKTAHTCLSLMGIDCEPKKPSEHFSNITNSPAGNDFGESEEIQEAS